MSAYDRWKTNPPDDEQGPSDMQFVEAEEELENDDWFVNEVEMRINDGLSEESAKKHVRDSNEYQTRLSDLASEIMEQEIEQALQDEADAKSNYEEEI